MATRLPVEENPVYLGVTFDNTEVKMRLVLMKKLDGRSWGADAKTIKRLYTGSVRPVLEYVLTITSWGTTTKSSFNKVSKVQN